MALRMTYEIAHAAATDAANRHMQEDGRTKWNESDLDVLAAAFDRLWPMEPESDMEMERRTR